MVFVFNNNSFFNSWTFEVLPVKWTVKKQKVKRDSK